MQIEGITGVPVSVILLGLLAGGTRVFLATEPPTLRIILGTICASLLLAIALHPMLSDREYSNGLITFLVAIGSFAAADILRILPKLLSQINKNPLAIIKDFLAFYYGQKPKDRNDEP